MSFFRFVAGVRISGLVVPVWEGIKHGTALPHQHADTRIHHFFSPAVLLWASLPARTPHRVEPSENVHGESIIFHLNLIVKAPQLGNYSKVQGVIN
jgi:hypothetical protein